MDGPYSAFLDNGNVLMRALRGILLARNALMQAMFTLMLAMYVILRGMEAILRTICAILDTCGAILRRKITDIVSKIAHRPCIKSSTVCKMPLDVSIDADIPHILAKWLYVTVHQFSKQIYPECTKTATA